MTLAAARSAVLTTDVPHVDEAEAAHLARDRFGVAGRASRLPSERDGNFRIAAPDGRSFVLKLSNAAEDPAITGFQTAALRHIAARAPGLPVPLVRPSVDGTDMTVVTVAAGTRHVVRLLTYLRGEPLHRAAPSPAQAANLGRCLAGIGLALRDFRHEAADHDLLWDLKGAARLRPLLPHVADDRRALATRGLDRFEADVLPRLAGFRHQVVHNDLNPHNVLVDPADPTRVTGVLDFGDMVDTPLVNDVAVAAAYQARDPDMLGRMAALVGAYHAVAPLRPEEVEVLGDLIALRQIMTLVIAGWRASLYPDNRAYILRNEPRTAAALEALEAIGRPAILARLRAACTPGALARGLHDGVTP